MLYTPLRSRLLRLHAPAAGGAGRAGLLGSPLNPAADTRARPRHLRHADLFANLTRRYGKPEWRIDSVEINGHPVRVRPTDGLVDALGAS